MVYPGYVLNYKTNIMQRFLDKVNKTDSCWLWTASKRGKSGYGSFKYKGKTQDAHRVSYMIFKGEIPDGMVIMHQCDNRICVNPNHLHIGTQKENMQDAYRKGRMVIPDGNKFAIGNKRNRVLSDSKLLEVKNAINNRGKKSLKVVAQEQNISYYTVRDISCNRYYK